MKKAKFNDVFTLFGGSCIGHYVQEDSSCLNCKIKEQCKKNKENKIYPKSIKQAQNTIKKLKSFAQ